MQGLGAQSKSFNLLYFFLLDIYFRKENLFSANFLLSGNCRSSQRKLQYNSNN